MKTPQNTHLSKEPLGYGHWRVTASTFDEEKSIITSDSILIDEAFNSDDEGCWYYESQDEARQELIDRIF